MKKVEQKTYTLHQHDMADFMQCPFRYYMNTVRCYEPKVLGNAINIGALFSKGVERLHTTGNIEESMLLVQAAHDMKLLNANSLNMSEDINTDAGIVSAMLTGYNKNYITNYKNNMQISKIVPEYKIEWVKEYCGMRFIYICSLDGKVFDSANDIYILEIKTAAQVQKDLLLELPTNFQINSYWAAMVDSEKITPQGVLYRFVVKPTIRLKKTETLDQFRKRVIGEYETNTEKYFYEEKLFFDYKNVRAFNVDLDAAFQDLVRCLITDRWPKRGTACRTKFGSFCKNIHYCSNPSKETLETYYKLRG